MAKAPAGKRMVGMSVYFHIVVFEHLWFDFVHFPYHKIVQKGFLQHDVLEFKGKSEAIPAAVLCNMTGSRNHLEDISLPLEDGAEPKCIIT